MIKNDDDYLKQRTYTNYGGSDMCVCERKELTIRITVDRWNDKEKKYYPYNDYDVEYCPMCGRKLEWEE